MWAATCVLADLSCVSPTFMLLWINKYSLARTQMTKSTNAQRVKPCMPPLLEVETNPLSSHLTRKEGLTAFSGNTCETLVKSYFLSKGVNVAEPSVDNGVDLLIEKPEGWVKGQVKKVVYRTKLDWGMSKRGKEIYRSCFTFPFQGSGGENKRQRKFGDTDYFYHTLITPYRQLIWEVPQTLVPLRKNGEYVQCKNPTLDRDNWIRKKADFDFTDLLIYSFYDPIVFKTYPQFFLEEKVNIFDFM